MPLQTDTIVAQATPPGRGGIAVVRISGPLVTQIASHLLKKIPPARQALYTPFYNEKSDVIDEGIAIYFPHPHSFTGENVLELQGHGGPAVVDMLIRQILTLGARVARPGEFSERAFLNDKLDLIQAEAIADLIDASSEQAARAAMKSLQGEFSKHILTLVEKLIHLRMYVEAAIDFAEEEVDFLADGQIKQDLLMIIHQLEKVNTAATQGRLLQGGIKVVITGAPNAGKSSLLNALSGKDLAIVTHIPGTTRDVLREYISLDGLPIHIIDTAGLRESEDVIEQEGIKRARKEIEAADLVLVVTDAVSSAQAFNIDLPQDIPIIEVRNKIDLLNEAPKIETLPRKTIVSLSVKNNSGLALLTHHIKAIVGFNANLEGSFSARRRHLDAIARAQTFLKNGEEQLRLHCAGELLADDLRHAQLALAEITGDFHSEDLLGRIFSSFCIGK